MKVKLGIELLGSDYRISGAIPKYEYLSNGSKGAQTGYIVDILLPHANFEKIRVSLPMLDIPVTQEQIENANKALQPIKCVLEGFEASPYVDKTGQIKYSAKAVGISFPTLRKESN